MVPDISQKISDQIVKGINTEAEAVYLMVQVRKLLEIYPSDDYPHLNFHCDWALHPRMDRKPAQKILKLFDDVNVQLRKGVIFKDLPDNLRQEIELVFGMSLFRRELDTFLERHSLPTVNYIKDGWAKFLWLLAKVIEDCPLEIKPANIGSSVQKITIKVDLANTVVEGEQFYKITWMVSDVNGNNGELYVLNSFSVAGD